MERGDCRKSTDGISHMGMPGLARPMVSLVGVDGDYRLTVADYHKGTVLQLSKSIMTSAKNKMLSLGIHSAAIRINSGVQQLNQQSVLCLVEGPDLPPLTPLYSFSSPSLLGNCSHAWDPEEAGAVIDVPQERGDDSLSLLEHQLEEIIILFIHNNHL